ncbi:hypothetical protein CRM22_004266 [Opisthorchis felineus]|uniref:Uncharacterized protein n=1 Tax=Opisthorchis felineus TaxID=147828 RepID=A0A4S2LXV1_OPIFE|nr:hypothetical protein CRM22_004266 [Opisthorchis felineus]TGZ68436.1 hypothetical protein CRM22_004266 [Opisthorchis felineus]
MTCRHFVGSSPCTGHDLLTDGHAQIAIDPDAMAQISKHSQSNVDQSKDTLSEENIQGLPDTDVIKLHRLIKNSLEIPNAPNVVHETDTWLQQVKYRVPGKSIAADAESSKARHETKFSCTHKELSQTAHVKPLNPHIRLLLTVGLTQRDILSWGSKIQGNKKGTFSKIFPKGLGSPKEGNKFCVIIDLNDYGAPELLSHNGFEEDQEEPGPQLLMESLQLPEALGRDDVPPIIYPELSCRNQSNSLSEQRGMTHTTDESQTKVSGPANAEGAIKMLEKFHVQSYSIPSSSRSLIKSSLRSELKAKPRSSMYEKRLLNHSVHKRTQNGSSQDQRVPSRLKNVRMTGKRVDQVSVNPPSQPNSTRVRSTHSAKHASLSTAHPTLRSSLAFLVDRRPKIPKSKRNTSSEISLASSLRERHSDDAVHRKETSTKGNYVGKGSGQHLAVPKLPGEVLDIFLNEESSRASPATGPWRRDQSHPRKQHEKSEFRSPLKPFNLYKIRSESDVSKFQGNISVAQWVKYNKACTPKSQVIARRDSRLRHVNKDHVRSQSYQFDRSSEQIEHAVQDRYDTHINLPSTSACHLESASFQDGIFLELGCISIRKTKEHFRESAQEAHVLQDVKQEDFRPRGRDPNQLLLDGQHQTSSKQREELNILAAPTVDECREVCVPGARIPHGYAVSLSKDNSLHKTCLNMQRMNFVFEEGGTSRTDDANRTQNSGKAERIWSRTMHRSKHLRSTTTDLTLQLSLHNSQPSSRLHHVNTIKLSTVELKRDMTTHGRSTSNWIERRKALKTPGAYSTRQSAIKPKVNQVQKVSQTHRKRTGETKPTNSRRHTEYFQRHSSSHQMKLASTDHQLRLQRVTQYMQPKTQLADLWQSLSEKPALGKPQDELIQPKLVPLKQVECSLPYANRTLYGDSHTPTSIFRLLRKSRSQPLRRSSQPTAQELDGRVPLYEIRADADNSVYHTVAAERERDTNTNVKSQQDIPKRSESVRSMDDDFRLQSTRHSGKRICPVVSNQETRIRARPWRSSSDEHLLPRHSEYKLFNRSFDSKTIPIQSGRYSKSSTQEVLGNPSVQQRLRYPSNRKKEGASLSLAPGVYETDQVHRPLLEISCNSDVFSPQVDALPETHFRQDDKQHRDLEKTEHINLTRDSDSTESSIRMHKLVDPASPSSPIFVAQKQPELTGELSVIEYSFRQCLDFNNQQSEKPQNYQSSSEPEMGETAMEYVDRPASMKSFHPNESRSSKVSHLSLISTRDMSEDRPSSLVRTFRKNSDRSTSTTSGLSSIGDRLRSVQQSLDRPLEENRRDSKETVLSSEKRSELIQLERTSLHYWVPGEPSGVHKHHAESATGSSVRSARQSSELKPPVSRLERRDQSVDQQVVKSSTLNDRQVESAGSRGHSTHAKFHRISMQNDEVHYPNLEELEPAQTTTYPDQEVGLTAQQLHLPHSSQRQPEVQSYSARPSKLMHFGEMISMSTPQLATGNRVSKTSLKTVLASAASTSKIHNILDLQTESKTERISERDSNFGQEGKPKGRVSTSSHSKGNKVGSVDNSIKTAFGVRDRITKERYTTMRKNNQQRVYEVYGMPRIVGKRVNRDLKRQTLGEPHLVRRKLRSGSRWESEREGEDQSLANFGFRSQTPPKSDRRKRFFYSSVEQYSSPSQHSLLSDLSSTMLSRTNGKNTFEQRKADSVHALSPAFSTYSRLPIGRGKAYYRGSKNRGRTTYRVQHVLQNLRRVQQEKKRAQLAGRGRSTGSHRVNQRAGFRGRGRFSHRKSGSDIESYREYVKSDSISTEQYPSIAERSLISVQSPLSVDLSSTNLPKPRAKPRRLSEEKGRSGAQVHQTYEDRIGSDASKDRDSTNNPLKESNGITDEQDCKQKSHEIDEHSHGTRNRRSHQLRGSTMVKAQQVGKDQLVDHQQSSKHQEDTVVDHCVADLTLQDLELFSEQDSRTSGLKEHKYSPAERISVTSSARSITELSYGSLNLRPEYTSEHHVATAAGQKSSKHKTTKNLPPFIQRENTGQQRESSENREINKEISHENATVKAVNSKDKLEYPKPKPGRDSENQRIPSDKSEGSKRTHGETGGKDRTPSRERSRDKTSTGQHEKYQDQREDSSCLGQKGKPNAFPQSVTSETPLPDRITGQPTSSDARSTSPLPDNRLDDEVIATGQRSDAQVREIFIYYPEEQSRPLANSIESRLEEKPSQALLRLETATMITPSAGEQGVMGTLEDDMGVPISPYNIGQPAAHSPKHMVMGSFGGERVVSDSFRSTVPEDKSPRLADSVKPTASAQRVTSETPLPDRITGQPTSSDARSTSPLPDNRLDDEVIATGQRSDAQVREIFIYYPEEQSRPLANSIESRLEEKPSQALLRLETATMITPSAGEQGVMGTLEDDMGVPISPYNIGQPAAHSPKYMVMGSFGGERVVSDSFRSTVPEDKSPRLADSVKPTASAQRVTSETPLPDRITGQPTSSDARSTSPLPDNSVDRDLAFFSASWNVGKYSAYGFRVTSRFLDDICVQMVVNPQGISLCVFEITNLEDSADVMEEYEPTLFAENGPLVITDSDSSESISVSCGVVLLCQEGDPLVLREINEPVLGYIFEPSQRQMSDEGKSKSGVDRITSKNVVFSPRVFVDTPVIDSDSRVPGIQVRSTDPEKPVPSFLKHQIDSTELKQSPVYQSAPQDGKNVVLVPQKSVVPGTRFRTDELPNVSLSLSKLPHDRNRDTLYLPISEYNLLIEQMPNESRDLEKEPKASCHGLQDSSFISADADIFHACNIGSPTDVRANHGTDALYGLGADAQAPSVPLSLSNEHHSFRAEQINLSPSEVDGFEVPPHKHSGVETLRTGKILGGKRAVDQREMSNQVKPLTDLSCQATPPTNDQLKYPTSNIFIPSTGTIPSSMDPVSPDHTTNSPQALPSINNRSSQSIDGYLAFLCLPSACDLIFEQPKRESVYIIQFEPILLTPLFTVPALSDQLQLFVAYPFELQPVHLVSPFDLLYEVVPLATTYYGTTWRQETFGPQTIGKSMPSDFVLLDPPERASLVPEKVATANELEVDGSAGDPERDQAMDDQISLPVQKTSCATARHPQYSLSSCPLTPHHETLIGSLNNLPDSRAIDETSSIFEAIKGTSVVSHSKSRSVVQATSKQVSTSIFTIKPGPTENQKDLLSLTPADRLHSDISIVADVIREGHPSMGTDQNRRRNLHIDSVATGGSLLVTPRGYSVDFKLPLASSASCLLTPNTCCNRCDTQTVAACVLSDTTVQPVCCHPMASSTRDNASLGGKMESVAQRRRQPVCSFGRCPQWMCLGSGVHQHTSVTKAGKHQLDNLKHDRIEKATQSLVTLDATDRPSETLISGSGTKFPGDVIGSDVLVPVPSKQLTDVEDTKINITTVIQFGNHKHDPTGRLLNAPGCMACRGKCKRINCGSVQNDHGFQRCFQRCKPRSRSCHLSSCPLVRHREASSEMYMAAPVYELFKLNEPICPTAAMLTRKTACQSLTRRRHPECRRTFRFHCCPLADVPVTSELSGHRFSECRVKRLCCCCRGYGCDQRNCSGCGSRTTE